MPSLKGETRSYYHAAAARAGKLPEYPSLDRDLSCEVVIVGGGLTGLSAALRLAKLGVDVVVLEQREVGWGASGRNGGQVLPGYAREMFRLRQVVGESRAHELWQFSMAAVNRLLALCDEHGIESDFVRGHLTAAVSQQDLEQAAFSAEDLHTTYGYDKLKVIGESQLRDFLETGKYVGGLIDMGGGHLDPVRLVVGLAQAAHAAGARIYHRSYAAGLRIDDRGWSLSSRGREVRSQKVFLANNVWLGKILPSVQPHVLPIYNFMIATGQLGVKLANDLIRGDFAVADTQYVLDYFRLTPDRRMLFGGGISFLPRSEAVIRRRTRRRMLDVFPQLRNTPVEHAWSGVLDMTVDLLPRVGCIGRSLHYAHGFSGHGLALSIAVGEEVAEAVMGKTHALEIFSGMPQPEYFRGPRSWLAAGFAGLRRKLFL